MTSQDTQNDLMNLMLDNQKLAAQRDRVDVVSCEWLEIIDARIAKIENEQGDPECAHSMEDSLHQDTLKHIQSGGCDCPDDCAKKALRSLEMDFSRWYA